MTPGRAAAPAGTPGRAVKNGDQLQAAKVNSTRGVRQPAGTWLADELARIETKVRAARLAAARGGVPRPAIRSAAVALVAVDAALSDLEVVRAMAAEVPA